MLASSQLGQTLVDLIMASVSSSSSFPMLMSTWRRFPGSVQWNWFARMQHEIACERGPTFEPIQCTTLWNGKICCTRRWRTLGRAHLMDWTLVNMWRGRSHKSPAGWGWNFNNFSGTDDDDADYTLAICHICMLRCNLAWNDSRRNGLSETMYRAGEHQLQGYYRTKEECENWGFDRTGWRSITCEADDLP